MPSPWYTLLHGAEESGTLQPEQEHLQQRNLDAPMSRADATFGLGQHVQTIYLPRRSIKRKATGPVDIALVPKLTHHGHNVSAVEIYHGRRLGMVVNCCAYDSQVQETTHKITTRSTQWCAE